MNPVCAWLVITCQSSSKFWYKKATGSSMKGFVFSHYHYHMFVFFLMDDFKLIHVPPFTRPPTSGYSLYPSTSSWTIIRICHSWVGPWPLCFLSAIPTLPLSPELSLASVIVIFDQITLFPYHRECEIESLEELFGPTHLSKLGHAILLQTPRSSCCENLLAGISCAPSARTELDSLKCRTKISSR